MADNNKKATINPTEAVNTIENIDRSIKEFEDNFEGDPLSVIRFIRAEIIKLKER